MDKKEFKVGDKVLVKATVSTQCDDDGDLCIQIKQFNGVHRKLIVKTEDVIHASEYEPGEMVDVCHPGEQWVERKFICEYKGQYITGGNSYMLNSWAHIQKIPQKIPKKPSIEFSLTINGEKMHPCDLSKETWENLREETWKWVLRE